MKLGILKRIPKENLQQAGDLPKWIDVLLDPLNSFIESIGNALQGRLTFEDNFLCKVDTQTYTAGVELLINPYRENQSNLRVKGVIPLYANGSIIDTFGWVRKQKGNIGVTFSFAGGVTAASCTILILLGE
jgi:hypothetical protein